eukprot:6194621-Pleurochrysis_carterae.AAC.3
MSRNAFSCPVSVLGSFMWTGNQGNALASSAAILKMSMNPMLRALARKFKHVKFVKIAYEDCIPGYPSKKLQDCRRAHKRTSRSQEKSLTRTRPASFLTFAHALLQERNLPTLLFYRDDDLLGQCVGVNAFGGSSYGVEGIAQSHACGTEE